jgi:hypothetical protein
VLELKQEKEVSAGHERFSFFCFFVVPQKEMEFRWLMRAEDMLTWLISGQWQLDVVARVNASRRLWLLLRLLVPRPPVRLPPGQSWVMTQSWSVT